MKLEITQAYFIPNPKFGGEVCFFHLQFKENIR